MGTGDASARRLFGIDIRSLRAFRMGLALLVLGDLAARAADLDAFYTDAGVLPRALLRIPRLRFSFHAMAGGRMAEEMLFLAAAAFGLLLLSGIWPRVTTAASWLLLASLDARNPLVLNHGDELLKILLFWSVFIPLPGRRRIPGEAGGRILSVFTAALVVQVCAVYFFSALLKTDRSWSVTGTAIASALSLEQLSTGLGRSLLDRPGLLRAATLLVYYLELLGPLAVFIPWRNRRIREAAIAAFIVLHLAIAATMSLGLFPWVSLLGWILFLPSETWDSLQGAPSRASGEAVPGNIFGKRGNLLPGAAAQVLGAYLLCSVLVWNLRCLGTKPEELHPSPLDAPMFAAQLDQRWNMFAPRPNYVSGWFVAPADLADGSHVDLMNGGGAVSWARPDVVAATYPDFRWRKYLINIGLSRFDGYGPGLSAYLRRHWDGTHPAAQKVGHLKVCFVWQDLSAGGNPPVKTTVVSED